MGYEGVPKRTSGGEKEAPMIHVTENGVEDPLNDAALERLEKRQKNDPEYRRGLIKALAIAGVATLAGDSTDVPDTVREKGKSSAEPTASTPDQSDALPEDVYEVSDDTYATTAPETSLRPQARPETKERTAESVIEWGADSERIKDRVDGYMAWWNLPNRHYQFVDTETGAPLEGMVEPQEFIVDKRDKMTPIEDEEDEYDENAYRLTEAETSTWLRFMAEQRGLAPGSWEQLNVNAAFEAAQKNEGEPRLQEGIESGTIQTNFDIVEYFGMNPERTVENDPENRTYAEYVRDELPKHLNIEDPVVKEEILKFAIGLIAKESRFNDKLPKNAVTAQQACQLTDQVRVEYLFKEDPSLSAEENEKRKKIIADRKLTFPEEVKLCGKKFTDIYHRVSHWIDHGYEKIDGKWQQTDRAGNLELLKNLYASEADWKRYGLVPLMLVAYNTGAARVGDMVDAYLNKQGSVTTTSWENVQGYDVYYDISHEAKESDEGRLKGFGPDGFGYVPMIFAATEVIAKEHPELMRERPREYAQN